MRQGRESRGRAVREMMVAWKCVEMVEMFWKCRGDRSCNTDLNCELRAHDAAAEPAPAATCIVRPAPARHCAHGFFFAFR